MRHHFSLLAWVSMFSSCVAFAEPAVTVGNTVSYFQGDYGTGSTIDTYYDATTIQYGDGNAWRVKLTLPYISETGIPNGAIVAGGTATDTNSNTTKTHSASGIGDVWLSGHYEVYQGQGLVPSVTPYAKVKFGTASLASGLGTGQNDYEAGIGLQQVIGSAWFPFANLGYRMVGSPAGYALNNIAVYQAGVSHLVTDNDIVTGMYSGSQSDVSSTAAPSDIIVAWNHNVTKQGSGWQVYVDKGLSNGSANYGVGVGGQIVF